MPVTDTTALDPIYRLLDLAQSDTGQARRAANFLLSWWNAQNRGGFDLTDLWAVDKKVADDMLAAATFIAQHNEYPTAYGLGPQFEQLVADWRPHLVQAQSDC
jgi:hypothetical protein